MGWAGLLLRAPAPEGFALKCRAGTAKSRTAKDEVYRDRENHPQGPSCTFAVAEAATAAHRSERARYAASVREAAGSRPASFLRVDSPGKQIFSGAFMFRTVRQDSASSRSRGRDRSCAAGRCRCGLRCRVSDRLRATHRSNDQAQHIAHR